MARSGSHEGWRVVAGGGVGAVSAEIHLTRVRKHGGAPLSKRISLGEDGRPVSDGSP
jgi:hypothetical protein